MDKRVGEALAYLFLACVAVICVALTIWAVRAIL